MTLVGIVGREKTGKTFIMNRICDLNLPVGNNFDTKGLSMKFSKGDNIICLDSAGIQTPVYYYDNKLLEKFSWSKEDLRNDEGIKDDMKNDRTLTDLFIQDFILKVCEVIIIVIGHLSQNDQNFIQRISKKSKPKQRIIIIHNFIDLKKIEDVNEKIRKDVFLAFDDVVARNIPDSDIEEYIERNFDKKKENISHLILVSEDYESGLKYNHVSLQYLCNILDTRTEKTNFNPIESLTKFFEENYKKYLRFQ